MSNIDELALATVEFAAEVFQWRGPSPYYFAALPEKESVALKTRAAGYGWGMIPVTVKIGDTEWNTSLWQRDGRYLVPIEDMVRKAEQLDDTHAVTIQLTPTRPCNQAPSGVGTEEEQATSSAPTDHRRPTHDRPR